MGKIFSETTRPRYNFKPLANFCACTAWFVSGLFGNHNVGFLMRRLNKLPCYSMIPFQNTNVTLIVTSRAGVITGSDLANARTLLCTPSTGAVNVTSSLTAGYVFGTLYSCIRQRCKKSLTAG